jgi:NADP-dependent 3-hydroxy acid dehydrogenase YdfG
LSELLRVLLGDQEMPKALEGLTAVVTGASSGIGEATALALAKEGAKVALLARRKDRLDQLAKKIASHGGHSISLECDVSDPEQARQAVQESDKRFGRLDILVNNAGLMLLGPIDGADLSDWRRMVDTNILGLMYCTHAALPLMKANKQGHIVNISSVSGRIASAGTAVYNATKWAVGAFSEALRQEVHKDKIRVTIIEPGAVLTELTDHITNAGAKKRVKDWVETLQPLTPTDIADAILYAVSQPRHVNVNEILIRPTDQLP